MKRKKLQLIIAEQNEENLDKPASEWNGIAALKHKPGE